MLLDPANSRKVAAQAFLYAGVFFGAAVMLYVAGAVQRSGAASTADVSAEQCLAHAQKFSVTGSKVDDAISFRWEDLKQAPVIIGVSSSIALSCPGWQVDHFCMGNGCTGKGAELKLKRTS